MQRFTGKGEGWGRVICEDCIRFVTDVLTVFKSNRFMGEEPECTALLSLSHIMSLNELYH